MGWQAYLGVMPTEDPAVWRLPITDAVTGGMGQLFGGCGLGAAVEILQELTGKPVAWATAQFLASTYPPEVMDLHATVPVAGRNFSQAHVTGRVGDRLVLSVMVALGSKSFNGAGTWRSMPAVPPPQHCAPGPDFGPDPAGLNARVELRMATAAEQVQASGATRVWLRMPGALAATPMGLSVLADFLPLALRATLGRELFGSSLDNTIRFTGRAPSSIDWVLADMQVDDISDGVAHGTVLLWAASGELLALATQTCGLRELSPDQPGSK